MRRAYQSDLSDAEWSCIEPHLPVPNAPGRPRVHAALRMRVRVRMDRDPKPSAGVVVSQSVKTTGVGGEERGFDAGKKVKGRKRHLLVDTQGLLLEAKVHSAEVMDYEGIKKTPLEGADRAFPRLSHLWLDAGYRAERARVQIG